MKEQAIKACKDHINMLEEKLTKIYTVELFHYTPTDSVKNVDVRERLRLTKFLINIYSKLEREGIKQGETFEKYSTYLTNARYGVDRADEAIKQIEQENSAEIKNINILLEAFKLELKSLLQ
ncbi:hypothetical protein [Paenibacillus sp. FSL R7-0026]|uniref:hypothetical protein n=1 Tax=Paenibacillus sp. FSL R7-0026 TaxID=2921668 RepID=UPI0030F86603